MAIVASLLTPVVFEVHAMDAALSGYGPSFV